MDVLISTPRLYRVATNMIKTQHAVALGSLGGRMTTIDIRFDSEVFSADAVTRAAHRYTGEFFVRLESSGSDLLVCLAPRSDDADASSLAERLRNDVLDEQLRAHVRRETSELHTALVNAAMHPVLAKSGQES